MIDLENIENYHENNRIEAKRATGGFPHSLWETYSAFSNTIGGLILLGVEEARDKTLSVVGVPDAASYSRMFWEGVNDPAQVSVNILSPDHVSVQTVDGKDVLIIEVPRANRRDRPVYLEDSPFTGTYRRDGEGDYHCTHEEVRTMLRDRGDAPQDLAVLDGLSADALSRETVREFRLLMAIRNSGHPFTRLPNLEFLFSIGALARVGTQIHPTIAGLLLFGTLTDLSNTFPGYCLEYREEDTGISVYSDSGGWSGNLFDFYSKVSERLRTVSARLPNKEQISAGLQEAAVNAILHTDYFGGRGLHIVYSLDSLEITNSGLLRIPPDHARRGGIADPRNAVLTRMFALIGICSGTGVGLKGIYAMWAQQGWSEPTLREAFRPDQTILSLPLRMTATPAPRRQQIAEYLTEHVSASVAELSKSLCLKPVESQLALSELEQAGLVTHTMEEKQRIYRLRA